MNFIIECEDQRQQVQVLERLEREGYSWTNSGQPTNFVPLTKDPNGKIIITKPEMKISYTVNRELTIEQYEDSHKVVTCREYLGRRVIL